LDFQEYSKVSYKEGFDRDAGRGRKLSNSAVSCRSKLRMHNSVDYSDLFINPRDIRRQIVENSFDYRRDPSLYVLKDMFSERQTGKLG
jgi:hypothetical protein